MQPITLPELGEGIENATVALWHAKVGDQVKADDDVVEIVTDKAVFHIQAGSRGTLKVINADTGAKVAVGEALGFIELSENGK